MADVGCPSIMAVKVCFVNPSTSSGLLAST